MTNLTRRASLLSGVHLLAGFLFLAPSYIRPDSVAVHSWLRSLVVDGDFLFYNEWAGFGMVGNGFAYFKEVTPVEALANHWWIGTSIVSAPFYLASHVASVLLPGQLFPDNGFFGLDLATAAWTSVLFHALAMACAFLAISSLDDREGHRWGPTVAALVCASLGTPAFWYAFRMPIGTHAAGMMVVGLLTLLCIRDGRGRGNGTPSWHEPVLLGLVCGLAVTTRLQHVVLAPAVLYAVLSRRHSPRKEIQLIAAGAALPVLVQAAAWFAVYGSPLGPLAAGANLQGVTWMPFRRVSFLPVLVSSWRGLLVWSPIWAPAMAGLVLLARSRRFETHRRAGMVCLLMFAGELLANSTLDRYWWGGMSFGPRRFVDLTVPVAVGVWAFLRHTRLPGTVVAGLATVWSVTLMLAATAGSISLARYVSWGDLVHGVRSFAQSLEMAHLRSPLTSGPLALQSVVALVIILAISALLRNASAGDLRTTLRLALAWVGACLLSTLIAIAPTRWRAGDEALRFGLAGEAARSAGPLVDQRGLISDELAWLEASGRQREAERVRDEIRRIDKQLAELGVE